MAKQTIFIDGTEGGARNYYCLIESGANWVFNTEKQLYQHLEQEKIFLGANYEKKVKSGLLNDYGEPYEVVPLLNNNSKLKGTDDNYSPLNPFRK